jgi:hypothetical protein
MNRQSDLFYTIKASFIRLKRSIRNIFLFFKYTLSGQRKFLLVNFFFVSKECFKSLAIGKMSESEYLRKSVTLRLVRRAIEEVKQHLQTHRMGDQYHLKFLLWNLAGMVNS